MGSVHRAVDLDLDRTVAIKVIAETATSGPRSRERLLREARALARISHPNVLPIHRVGEHEGRLFIAMKLVPGQTLRGLLDLRTALAPGHALRLLTQVGGALDEIHRCDVVHRDVKPENILLEGPEGDEHAWLADFGLARPVQEEPAISERGAGTFWYMAPEQMRGARDAGARADLYSLALVLYEALTGRRLDLVERGDVRGRTPEHPLLTEGLREVFARALLPDPDDRFESAGALMAEARAELSRPRPGGAVSGGVLGRRSSSLHTTDPSGVGTRPPIGNGSSKVPVTKRRRSALLWGSVGAAMALGAAGLTVPVVLLASDDQPVPPSTAAAGTASSTPTILASSATPSATPSPTFAVTKPGLPPTPKRSRATSAPPTSAAPTISKAVTTSYDVCGKSVTVRAEHEELAQTTVVATLTYGNTFIVDDRYGTSWAHGYSPQVAGSKGWVLTQWIKRDC